MSDPNLTAQFRQFTESDGVRYPNGYVTALERVLGKCADLREQGGARYADDIAAEFERIFADIFGIEGERTTG